MSGRGYAFQAPRLSPAVKILLWTIGIAFILQLSLIQFGSIEALRILGFVPQLFVRGYFWQLITYPFLHGGLSHVVFNALILYLLGPELERRWGTKNFVKYYALCATGGAFVQMLIWLIGLQFFPAYAESLGSAPVIGASGALYGLMMAFGYLYGDAQVLMMFLFPIRAKYFVSILAAIELVSAVFYSRNSTEGIAHLVHLGGLLSGYLYLKFAGDNLDGRGGGWRRKREVMSRDELRQRLSLIVNKDEAEALAKKNKYPITWN